MYNVESLFGLMTLGLRARYFVSTTFDPVMVSELITYTSLYTQHDDFLV